MSLFGNNSLITRNLGPIPLWRKEMNQLIQKFNNETLNFESTDFLPSLEITEKAKGYTIRAEVPGMRESDINVTLNDNVLVLEGERKSENREEEEGLFSSEFSYGFFCRSIPLSEEVNPDAVKASYKDGILTVDLQKVKPSTHKSKKIPIHMS